MAKKKLPLIKNHILIPKHIKLSAKEKQALFEKYNITSTEFPKISKNDPAIFKLNVKEGDIIKIVRQSPTAGEAIFYRVVTNV